MAGDGGWTVGRVAHWSGVTVRTLHHYDAIGLVCPSGRSPAGYRRYAYADLERLQQVLAYRDLGFPLDKIAAILGDPDTDPVQHLRRQRAVLTDRIDDLQRIVAALDKTMEAHRMGIRLTPEEMFEVFGEHDPTQYADEAEQRWGESDAWRQSRQRTARYTKADWQQVKAEGDAATARLAAAKRAGLSADGAEAMAAAEAHRAHISRWFYDCPPEMHAGLGEMYVADPRFTATFEAIEPGLAAYARDAIAANAARRT